MYIGSIDAKIKVISMVGLCLTLVNFTNYFHTFLILFLYNKQNKKLRCENDYLYKKAKITIQIIWQVIL